MSGSIRHTIVSKSARLGYDIFQTKTFLKMSQKGPGPRSELLPFIGRRNELSDRVLDVTRTIEQLMCGSFPCPLVTLGMILMLSSRRRRPVPVIHGGSRRTYDLLYRQICSVVVGKLVMVLSYDLCLAVGPVLTIGL